MKERGSHVYNSQLKPELNIGDRLHFADCNRAALKAQNYLQRQSAAVVKTGKARNFAQGAQLKAARDAKERDLRTDDRIEQAKTFLRRRGAANVFNAAVHNLDPRYTFVDKMLFTDRELLERVERLKDGKRASPPDQAGRLPTPPKRHGEKPDNNARLLTRIEEFLAGSGMSESDFGRWACNDARLIADLYRGESLQVDVRAAIERKIKPNLNAGIVHAIDDYLSRTGLSQSAFGRLAVDYANLVPEMRRGRELRPETLSKVNTFMLDYPNGVRPDA